MANSGVFALVVFALFSGMVLASEDASCTIVDNTDYNNGYTVMLYNIPTAAACCDACSTFEECTAFTYEKLNSSGVWYQRCFVHRETSMSEANKAITAGTLRPNPAPPACADIEQQTDYDNGWLSLLEQVPDPNTCCEACSYYPGCNYWSYITDPKAGSPWYQRCFFKASNSNKKVSAGNIAGKSTPVTLPPARTGKRGLAWFNSRSCSDLKLMTEVSWIYNWGTNPDPLLVKCLAELGIGYVPMQWGGGGLDTLNQTIYGASKVLLTFNEPNFKSQSNVQPADAIKMWPQITAIAKQRGMMISSPAAAACGPNPETECYGGVWSPVPWFDAFFAGCTGCQVDFIATHIYTCNMTELTTFLEALKKYNKPVWLTEFACPAAGQPPAFEMNFMKQALAYLDSQSYIEKYAWFGTRLDPTDGWLGPQVDLLDDSKCALTDLGVFYATGKSMA